MQNQAISKSTDHPTVFPGEDQSAQTAVNPETPFPDWRRVPEDQRDRLIHHATRMPLNKGKGLLFGHGDRGGTLFFVETGRLEFSYEDDFGERHTLHEIGPGGFFGEVGMLTNKRRTADARVLEDGWAYLLTVDKMNVLIRECPDVTRVLLDGMAWRMSNAGGLIRGTVKHVPELLAAPKSPVESAIDKVVQHMGSHPFLLLNAILFAGWVGWCLAHGIHNVTRPEFAGLALFISVEAMFLSILVLTSQNRQEKVDA